MIRYTRHAVFLAVSGLATAAWAQTAPAAAPAPAAPPGVPGAAETPTPAPTPAEAPPPPALTPADAARLDEIDQVARISLRKHELLEEEAAKKAKEAPRVTADDKGFSIGLPDKAFLLRIRGLVQADGRFFLDNDLLASTDTFLIRKFRPYVEGTVFNLIDFRLMPEFAGTVQILDGYVDLHPWEWLRLRAGQMKAPVGLERLQGDADRVFLEQSLISNLSSQRDVGVTLWGDVKGGIVHYVVGIFNGAPDTTSNPTDIITPRTSRRASSSIRSAPTPSRTSATSASASPSRPATARAPPTRPRTSPPRCRRSRRACHLTGPRARTGSSSTWRPRPTRRAR